jgi:hypothetical protein
MNAMLNIGDPLQKASNDDWVCCINNIVIQKKKAFADSICLQRKNLFKPTMLPER